MRGRVRRLVSAGALLAGIALFVVALRRSNLSALAAAPRQLGVGLLLAMVPSALWHLFRTLAWWRAFPTHARIPLFRACRVRLAAEAFSYVTVSGLAGDPLKVVLLGRSVPATTAAGAVALERLAYIIVTAIILAVAAAAAAIWLHLDPAWTRAFIVISIVAVSITVALPLLLRRPWSPHAPTSAYGRFVHGLAREIRVLASDRQRLGALFVLEAAAYLMMVLEVWAIMRVTGTTVSWTDIVAVETFTRAATFASAIIPAILGALEISNVAAATAVHAASAAAALALIRRLRGLLWCAIGFLIYPRRAADPPRDTRPLVVLDDGRHTLLLTARLGGLPAAERVLRAATRAGYTHVLVWTAPERQPEWRASRRSDAGVAVVATSDPHEWNRQLGVFTNDIPQRITVLAPGTIPSPALLEAALTTVPDDDRPVTEVAAGPTYPHSGVFRVAIGLAATPSALVDRVDQGNRDPIAPVQALWSKRAQLSMHVTTREDAALAEYRLRASIVKPTDGRVGRFNRRLSVPVSVRLIRFTRLSPHVMTIALMLLGLYAGWLFSAGGYVSGIEAALLSWVASVLDGCDGELARLQYEESAFGCWLDTLGDYIYYVAIFAGITIGVARDTQWPGFLWTGGALGVGMLMTFGLLILLRWRMTDGRPELLRTRARGHFTAAAPWTRLLAKLDTFATRATMAYGIVLFAVFDALPALVILAALSVQVYWISLARQAGAMLNRPDRALDPVRS